LDVPILRPDRLAEKAKTEGRRPMKRWLKGLWEWASTPTITVDVDPVVVKAQVRDARLFVDYAMAQPSASDIETACKIIGRLAGRLEEFVGGPK
jgi:hypothetical protein